MDCWKGFESDGFDVQNSVGSGVVTREEFLGSDEKVTWTKDERGLISRVRSHVPTGGITQHIYDVDTTRIAAPDGWVTLKGGGEHWITDFEHDELGRMIASTGPYQTRIDAEGNTVVLPPDSCSTSYAGMIEAG